MIRQAFFLGFVSYASANFGGFVPAFPVQSTNIFQNQNVFQNALNTANGNSAAAGSAGALGPGSAASINQANHVADRFRTESNALSANTATGFSPFANGAAQAGGSVLGSHQTGISSTNLFSNQLAFGRRKRQAFLGFPGFSNANANAVGGGSVGFGSINSNNVAHTLTNRMSASGFGASNTNAHGFGANIFSAANSQSQSGGYPFLY